MIQYKKICVGEEMAVRNQKKKILYLMKIFLEKTDEKHMLSAVELCNLLCEYGILAERKSIYDDIQTLIEFGMNIVQVKGKQGGYYLRSREFELAELKLLVDAVQTSNFITVQKSNLLIKKLGRMTSQHNEKNLKRNIYLYNRPKTENENIFRNVDFIHWSITENKQLSFRYVEWNVKKQMQYRRDGKIYYVSPWALVWDDENYYLVCYHHEDQQIKHYRVDKIHDLQIIQEQRKGMELFGKMNLTDFSKKTFGMYGGCDEEVILRCHNSLVGVILDRYGKNIWMMPENEEYFKVKILVTVSRQFFGWMVGIGENIELVSPSYVREEFIEYLENIRKKYK